MFCNSFSILVNPGAGLNGIVEACDVSPETVEDLLSALIKVVTGLEEFHETSLNQRLTKFQTSAFFATILISTALLGPLGLMALGTGLTAAASPPTLLGQGP